MASKLRRISDKIKDRVDFFGGSAEDIPSILANEQVPEIESDEEDTERKIKNVKQDIAEAKEVVEKTIHSMVERGEKLSEVSERAETLAERSTEFKRNTEAVRKKTWCENQKMKIIIGVILFVVMGIIIGVIVAIILSKKLN